MAAKLLTKIWASGPGRRSRLHDAMGERATVSRVARNLPRAVVTGIRRLATGKWPHRPWISYDVQDRFRAHLTPTSRVLEFGLGMSTSWYAARAGEVVAVEADSDWARRVAGFLKDQGQNNVIIRLASDLADYVVLPAGMAKSGFDLIVIDGHFRAECVPFAITALRPGGMIYLDNSDVSPDARAPLLSWAKGIGAAVTSFTDFAPCLFHVTQGMLIETGNSASHPGPASKGLDGP